MCTTFPLATKSILTGFSFKIRLLGIARLYRSIGTQPDLTSLLKESFHQEATNLRDKVYGILGMANSINDPAVQTPDYSRSPQEVHEDLTLFIIRSINNLDMFVGESLRHSQSPPWIADWGQSSKDGVWKWELERMTAYHHYESTKNMALVVELLPESTLKVEAACIDTVSAVGPVMDPTSLTDSSSLTVHEILAMAGLEGNVERPYQRGRTWADAYWRTLCGDLITEIQSAFDYNMRHTQPKDKYLYEIWDTLVRNAFFGTDICPTEDLQRNVNYFHTSVLRATRNRRFFITKNGYVGLGPSVLEHGDKVFLISGSKVPLVLRRMEVPNTTKNYTIPEHSHFQVVGDCYLHRLMKGELVEDQPAKFGALALH
jgi:hypothetical protein